MATFKWSIDNFSSFLDKGEGWTNSRVFKIMGHDWYGLQLQLSFSALQFVASLSSYFLQLELLHNIVWFIAWSLMTNLQVLETESNGQKQL